MNPDYWHKSWQENKTAWYQKKANPFLVRYFQELSLPKNSRIFVPLCGNSIDIVWLLSQGYKVVGIDLSEIAIRQLFQELSVEAKASPIAKLTHYAATDIDIFVGNIFDLSKDLIGTVDAIYDRAALVALPEDMRREYRAHLLEITARAPQLLLTFSYDQNLMDGPPFSIDKEKVHQHYQENYNLKFLESADVRGKLKGQVEAKENAWLLSTGY